MACATGLELIRGDLSQLDSMPALAGRTFDRITLTKRPYPLSDLFNVFSAAGLWIEAAIEPRLSEDARRRYPHKRAWMDKYLGIPVFKLRPRPGQGPPSSLPATARCWRSHGEGSTQAVRTPSDLAVPVAHWRDLFERGGVR